MNIPIDPSLADILKAAKNHKITDEELSAQRASWVRGEMGIGMDADEEKYKRENGF